MLYFYHIQYRNADNTLHESTGYAEDLQAAISKIESEGGTVIEIDYES